MKIGQYTISLKVHVLVEDDQPDKAARAQATANPPAPQAQSERPQTPKNGPPAAQGPRASTVRAKSY